MEWNRIETKWHEMARRLQNMTPAERQNLSAGRIADAQDAVSQPEPKTPSRIRGADTATSSLRALA
ncbi:hypothetical protein GEU84_013790 [Fertoebacter nigrum]|uniref:Uncharacterized protein n=1 Tax=Fertoeibacter niger TaxID=2656921 RepID=A0A8X8KPT7_9RHOB|nr:hypothetical protein [Fertoeibacter niger]NUB45465.1 hypothetical protein [Fertoeibacter niger]